MKKPSDHIFRLIHAMTPAEKRYFKRHFASEQSVLTHLFDFINKMKSYDEQLIKQSFEDNVARNFKVYKVQLFELLMDSLQAFGSNKNVKTKIRRGLEEVDILLDKQLYDLAADRLKRLKRLCLKYEEFSYLIELAYKEFFVHHITIDQIGISDHPVFQEVEAYLQKLKNHNQLTFLGHQLMDKIRKISLGIDSIEKSYFEKILADKKVQQASESLPFQTKLTQNTILSFVATYLEDKKLLEESKRNNVALFEAQPHFKKTMAFQYIAVMRNYLNYCIEEKQYQFVPDLLRKATTYAQSNPNMAVHLIHFYYADVQMHFNLKQFEKIAPLEKLILEHLDKFNIQRERIAMLCYFYFLFYAYFNADQEKVSFYTKELEETNINLGNSFQNYLYILKMIGAFEDEDDDELYKVWQKAKRANPRNSHFWKAILKLFDQLIHQPFQKRSIFSHFIRESKQFNGDALWNIFNFHRMDEWLKAHQNGQSLREWMLNGT